MTTTTYLWDSESDNLLSEDDGTAITSYTNEPGQFGELVSENNSLTANTNFYHFDARGDTRDLTDDAETVKDTRLNDAWGNVINATGSIPIRFLFVGNLGYYFDTDTRNHYVRARHYTPIVGRWLSTDPLFLVDGSNLYRAYFIPGKSDPSGNSLKIWDLGYGNYCGPTRAARCIGLTPDPRLTNPRDDLDAACAKHDCCLRTAWEFLDPCQQYRCNQPLCRAAIKSYETCKTSPTNAKCGWYVQLILVSGFCAMHIDDILIQNWD